VVNEEKKSESICTKVRHKKHSYANLHAKVEFSTGGATGLN